jgi:signal transduction histidine kinase
VTAVPFHVQLVRRLDELRRRAAADRARRDTALAEGRRLADGGGNASADALHGLVDAAEAAQHFSEEMSRLLADVSHDLRQPLLVLRMSLDMLERHLPEKAGRRELDRIQRTIERMEEALKALESAARLDVDAPTARADKGRREESD